MGFSRQEYWSGLPFPSPGDLPKTGQVVCYSHLLKNFPQFVLIHTVKGFSVAGEAEIDVFLEFPCFSDDPVHVGNLKYGFSKFR